MTTHNRDLPPADSQAQSTLPYFSGDDPEFCEEYDAWVWTQGTNGEPGEGTPEWEAKLHEMALSHPDAVINESEDECDDEGQEQDEAPCSENSYSTDATEQSMDSTASTTESPWPNASMLPALDEDETLKEYKVTIKEDMHMWYARKKEPVVIPTDKGDIHIYLAKKGKPNVIMLPAQCGIDLTLELFKKGRHRGRRVHVPPFHEGLKIISPGVKISTSLKSETDLDVWVNNDGVACATRSPQQ